MMVLIGAPASGQGKTTVTAGIARDCQAFILLQVMRDQ